MLMQFSQVLAVAVIAALFIFFTLLAGRFVRPKNPSVVKSEIYECGEPAVGPAWINFNIRFYIIALVFVIFDVEAALLFPAAAVFKNWIAGGRGGLAFFEIALFVLILLVGLAYVWKKKDLDWVRTFRKT